jgi:hypothetical protein
MENHATAAKLGERSVSHAIIQYIPVAASLLLGPHFIIHAANSKQLQLWQKTSAEAIGKPILEVLPEIIGQEGI